MLTRPLIVQPCQTAGQKLSQSVVQAVSSEYASQRTHLINLCRPPALWSPAPPLRPIDGPLANEDGHGSSHSSRSAAIRRIPAVGEWLMR